MTFKLTYMSGAGNLFTVVDGRYCPLTTDEFSMYAPMMCRINEFNKFETEGLLVIKPGIDEFDFVAEFFNPDGSTGAMCGNGSRCAVQFALKNGFFSKPAGQKVVFLMAGRLYTALHDQGLVSVFFPPPLAVRPDVRVSVGQFIIKGAYVDVGSDHLVVNVDDAGIPASTEFRDVDLTKFALPLRNHKDFAPRGVNVNLYKVANDNTLFLRTFERGVESETGACGTGSISTAIISAQKGEVRFPVNIIPTSGQSLTVDITGRLDEKSDNIILTGNAVFLDTVDFDAFL